MDQLIGWAGNLCHVTGATFLAHRRPGQGCLFHAIGSAHYLAQSLLLGNASLAFLSVVLGTLNIVAWRKYGKR